MRCENKNCESIEMKVDSIKVIRPDKKDVYYCSQKCFDETNGIKFRWNSDEISNYINWLKINSIG